VSQSGGPAQPAIGFQLSPDEKWWWDGSVWRSALSPDGRMRWTGYAWVAAGARGVAMGMSGRLIALIAGSLAVVLIVVTVMVYVAVNAARGGAPTSAGNPLLSANPIPCDGLEHTQVHYHAHLQIVAGGNIVPISTSVGRTALCYYWLHMHTGEEASSTSRRLPTTPSRSVTSSGSGAHGAASISCSTPITFRPRPCQAARRWSSTSMRTMAPDRTSTAAIPQRSCSETTK